MVYGTNAEGKRAFVMPYSEGRFGYHDKYYTLPKGSVDLNESVSAGAIREMEEETGLSVARLLGAEGYAALKEGKPLSGLPIESPGYPGVRVLRVGQVPVDYSYTARSGRQFHAAIYGVEVANIETLAPYLKNAENARKADSKVVHSVQDTVRDGVRYPQWNDFMEWLTTGVMPPRAWNGYQALPQFAGLAAHFPPGQLRGMAEWKRMYAQLPPEQLLAFDAAIAQIKHTVAALGITQGDHACIKLDSQDTPLNFFQEGADVITAEALLSHSLAMFRKNSDYRLAIGGGAARDISPKHKLRFHHSELAGVAHFVPEQELLQASLRKPERWLQQEAFTMPGKKHFKKGMNPLVELHPFFTQDKDAPDYWRSVALSAGAGEIGR